MQVRFRNLEANLLDTECIQSCYRMFSFYRLPGTTKKRLRPALGVTWLEAALNFETWLEDLAFGDDGAVALLAGPSALGACGIV
jgi:hypothetical protein